MKWTYLSFCVGSFLGSCTRYDSRISPTSPQQSRHHKNQQNCTNNRNCRCQLHYQVWTTANHITKSIKLYYIKKQLNRVLNAKLIITLDINDFKISNMLNVTTLIKLMPMTSLLIWHHCATILLLQQFFFNEFFPSHRHVGPYSGTEFLSPSVIIETMHGDSAWHTVPDYIPPFAGSRYAYTKGWRDWQFARPTMITHPSANQAQHLFSANLLFSICFTMSLEQVSSFTASTSFHLWLFSFLFYFCHFYCCCSISSFIIHNSLCFTGNPAVILVKSHEFDKGNKESFQVGMAVMFTLYM